MGTSAPASKNAGFRERIAQGRLCDGWDYGQVFLLMEMERQKDYASALLKKLS